MEYASLKMKDFTKDLESKRPADFKPLDATSQVTEELKVRNQKLMQDESMLKIKEVERLLKEAPRFKFNANVFKQNVKLALSEEEILADEVLVKDLSSFLIKEQISSIVTSLKSGDGVPTDSQSM
jgi:hypothetical protein